MVMAGEYSDEYINHFSTLMGISAASLRSRLKLYHDIKIGAYDGSGLEDISFNHPVEEWERTKAAADFLGISDVDILSDADFIKYKKTTIPFGDDCMLDDIFSEENEQILSAHRKFLFGSKIKHSNNFFDD
jgi:hypothetical protein